MTATVRSDWTKKARARTYDFGAEEEPIAVVDELLDELLVLHSCLVFTGVNFNMYAAIHTLSNPIHTQPDG